MGSRDNWSFSKDIHQSSHWWMPSGVKHELNIYLLSSGREEENKKEERKNGGSPRHAQEQTFGHLRNFTGRDIGTCRLQTPLGLGSS